MAGATGATAAPAAAAGLARDPDRRVPPIPGSTLTKPSTMTASSTDDAAATRTRRLVDVCAVVAGMKPGARLAVRVWAVIVRSSVV